MTVFGGTLKPEGTHVFPVRVYFEDTDFSSNVYHAAYLKFFERARTEFLRAHDVHHAELASDGFAFAVRHMDISFDRAAHIDDLLDVETRLLQMSGARFVLAQTMRLAGAVVCSATVTAVLLNASGRPVRLPKSLQTRFSGH